MTTTLQPTERRKPNFRLMPLPWLAPAGILTGGSSAVFNWDFVAYFKIFAHNGLSIVRIC